MSIISGTYFLIGEILVYFKIKKYKEKAQEIYEDIIMNKRYYYEQMKKCVYYGEEEYRNLFFNIHAFPPKPISKENINKFLMYIRNGGKMKIPKNWNKIP